MVTGLQSQFWSSGGAAGVIALYIFETYRLVVDCKSVYSGSIPLEAYN
mgnify:CR=1 FL=1